MTRDQQLEAVRAACIRANPEIASDLRGISQEDLDKEYDNFLNICRDFGSQKDEKQRTFMGVAMAFDRLKKLSAAAAVFQDRPVRLADVLLAMKPNTYFVDTQGGWWEWHKAGVEPFYFGVSKDWNLRKDDLEEQSNECVAFVAELLAKN